MEFNKKHITSFLIFSISASTMAATVNIDPLMQSSANSAVTAAYNKCLTGAPASVCGIRTGKAPAALSNISISANGIGTTNLVISQLPTSIDNISTWTFNNCLDVSYPINEKVIAVASEDFTINKKTTVQTEKSITVNGDYSFGEVAKVSASLSAKQVVTNENGLIFATNKSKTVEETINISVPPHTMYMFTLEAVKYGATMDYVGSVLLDASVLPTFTATCSDNCSYQQPRTYSTLVPNNTVSVNGTIASSYVSSTKWEYKQQPAVNCSAPLQKTSAAVASNSKVQNVGLVNLNNDYINYGVNNATPKQVTKSIKSGLQITTANVIGSIQVRAKSSYSDACKISFFANDKQRKTSLAPNIWSDWITVDTFTGVTVPFIYTQDECGGKISAEVKYFE